MQWCPLFSNDSTALRAASFGLFELTLRDENLRRRFVVNTGSSLVLKTNRQSPRFFQVRVRFSVTREVAKNQADIIFHVRTENSGCELI